MEERIASIRHPRHVMDESRPYQLDVLGVGFVTGFVAVECTFGSTPQVFLCMLLH